MPKVALKANVAVTQKVAPLVVVNTKLDALLEQRLVVGDKFAQLKAKKEKLDEEILSLVNKKTGRIDQGVVTDEFTVTPVNSSNHYIAKDLLLKAGVKPSVIEKATKVTPYSYPKITKKKVVEETE